MMPECQKIAQSTAVRLELVHRDEKTFVEAEFVNRYAVALWIAQEPTPSYRVDPKTGDVTISYGYFDDLYGPYRGRYMLPPMKEVAPGERLRWRIEDPVLIEKILVPQKSTLLRVRIALKEFTASNVRGSQPVDEYIDFSCPVQSQTTILRK